MVRYDTSESDAAERRASDGDYAAAARLAARSAHARFERYELAFHRTNSILAIGDLLDAILYARQAGDDRAARHLRGTLEEYAAILQKQTRARLAELWPAMTWACLVGLFEEWTGDAYLFTEDPEADEYYALAESWYRAEGCREETLNKHSPAPCWQWGHEPVFDVTWAPFEVYLEWLDADEGLDSDEEYDIHTFERLAYKRALVEDITG